MMPQDEAQKITDDVRTYLHPFVMGRIACGRLDSTELTRQVYTAVQKATRGRKRSTYSLMHASLPQYSERDDGSQDALSLDSSIHSGSFEDYGIIKPAFFDTIPDRYDAQDREEVIRILSPAIYGALDNSTQGIQERVGDEFLFELFDNRDKDGYAMCWALLRSDRPLHKLAASTMSWGMFLCHAEKPERVTKKYESADEWDKKVNAEPIAILAKTLDMMRGRGVNVDYRAITEDLFHELGRWHDFYVTPGDSMEQEIETLKKELGEHGGTIASLSEEVKTYQARVAELEAQQTNAGDAEKLRQQLGKKDERISKLEAKVREKDTRIQGIVKERDALRKGKK